ncbi:hypothetical protein B0H13DRAFT_2336418 [Mycena leptocephala]|nr:hypothetical protein B0H13DRAFT_2336418 [Mycena leptocephala]
MLHSALPLTSRYVTHDETSLAALAPASYRPRAPPPVSFTVFRTGGDPTLLVFRIGGGPLPCSSPASAGTFCPARSLTVAAHKSRASAPPSFKVFRIGGGPAPLRFFILAAYVGAGFFRSRRTSRTRQRLLIWVVPVVFRLFRVDFSLECTQAFRIDRARWHQFFVPSLFGSVQAVAAATALRMGASIFRPNARKHSALIVLVGTLFSFRLSRLRTSRSSGNSPSYGRIDLLFECTQALIVLVGHPFSFRVSGLRTSRRSGNGPSYGRVDFFLSGLRTSRRIGKALRMSPSAPVFALCLPSKPPHKASSSPTRLNSTFVARAPHRSRPVAPAPHRHAPAMHHRPRPRSNLTYFRIRYATAAPVPASPAVSSGSYPLCRPRYARCIGIVEVTPLWCFVAHPPGKHRSRLIVAHRRTGPTRAYTDRAGSPARSSFVFWRLLAGLGPCTLRRPPILVPRRHLYRYLVMFSIAHHIFVPAPSRASRELRFTASASTLIHVLAYTVTLVSAVFRCSTKPVTSYRFVTVERFTIIVQKLWLRAAAARPKIIVYNLHKYRFELTPARWLLDRALVHTGRGRKTPHVVFGPTSTLATYSKGGHPPEDALRHRMVIAHTHRPRNCVGKCIEIPPLRVAAFASEDHSSLRPASRVSCDGKIRVTRTRIATTYFSHGTPVLSRTGSSLSRKLAHDCRTVVRAVLDFIPTQGDFEHRMNVRILYCSPCLAAFGLSVRGRARSREVAGDRTPSPRTPTYVRLGSALTFAHSFPPHIGYALRVRNVKTISSPLNFGILTTDRALVYAGLFPYVAPCTIQQNHAKVALERSHDEPTQRTIGFFLAPSRPIRSSASLASPSFLLWCEVALCATHKPPILPISSSELDLALRALPPLRAVGAANAFGSFLWTRHFLCILRSRPSGRAAEPEGLFPHTRILY